MYVWNCWYVAAWAHEIGDDALIARKILGEPLVLFRAEDGGIVVMEDRCCHRFAPLSKGRLEGSQIRCMYHGLKFDRQGTCVEIPGQDIIPPGARIRTFPAVERHSWIWVWMGAPDAADEELIPPAKGLDDPQWSLRSGQMDFEANYELLNDNLTDFSHLSYVHANSFGAPEEFAFTRPKIERLDRGLRFWRWIDVPSRPALGNAVSSPPDVDSWQSYDFLAPGVLLMHSASFPKGTADRLQRRPPDDTAVPIGERFTSQAVTPIDERNTRYFFSNGPRAGPGSDQQAARMIEIARSAFQEDKDMIEAQQRIIDSAPARRPVLTAQDAGPTQMRAVLRRLRNADVPRESEDAPREHVEE